MEIIRTSDEQVEAEVRWSEMGTHQDVTFDENAEKVVDFRESHRRFETR